MSRLVVAALVLLGLSFVARALAPQTIGETARRQLLAQLQDHYSDFSVSIRRGHFDPSIGLIFEDIRIEDRGGLLGFGRTELVHLGRMTVMGIFDPDRLTESRSPIVTERVVIEDVQANVWLDPDGQPSLAALMPMPKLGPAAPRMDLRDVRVRLVGDHTTDRPVEAHLSSIAIRNRSDRLGNPVQTIAVTGSAELVDQFQAKLLIRGGETDVRVSTSGIRLSRDLFDRLPTQLTQNAMDVRDLSCVADAKISLLHSPTKPLKFLADVQVRDGRFFHASLPYPITGLRGKVSCNEGGIKIGACQANLSDSFVTARGTIGGYELPCPVELHVSTKGLMLDNQLASVLPPSVQVGWNKIRPVGRIDVNASVRFQNDRWLTDADLICKGVDVQYEKFPYPIEQLVGLIELRNNIFTSDGLSGRVGGNLIQCAFRMPVKPGVTNEKSFVVATDGALQIDNALLDALSPRGEPTSKLETFVRSLHPRGSVRLASAMFTTDANNRKQREIDLRVTNGHLRYDEFSYPLYNVSGVIKVNDDLVTLENFQANNANAGTILCNGTYRMPATKEPGSRQNSTLVNSSSASGQSSVLVPSAQQSIRPPSTESSQSDLALRFRASHVSMDDSLRQSLPPATRQAWDAISPSGTLDELDVILTKQGSGRPLALDITATQRDLGQVTSRTLSLRPPALPYRIDVTGGTVRFDGNQVRIRSLRGRHDASKISADGRCVQGKDGRWVLALDIHGGSRLHPDAELIAALPPQMREAMRGLQLRGPVSIRGKTELALPSELKPQTSIDWDVGLQLEGNRIGDVGPVHSLRGEILVQGHRDETQLTAQGHAHIDSMHVHDLQITEIQGPFSIVDDRLRLGSEKAGNAIEGQLFGGTIDLDGDVVLSSGNFDVGLSIVDGEVPTMLAEFGQSGQELTGSFSGQTQLQGNLGTIDLLRGSGAARISGANVYKLPLIFEVLNLLRVKPTEAHAFTDGEVEFKLFAETVTFSEMQIWGDLVALDGGGTMDRRGELDLTFNTRVSPQNTFTRMFRPLRSPKYTLWTIDVKGPLENPNIERRALDGVSETIGKWFPVMNEAAQDPSAENDRDVPSQARQGFTNRR